MKSSLLPVVIIAISCLIFLDNVIFLQFQTIVSSETFDSYYDVRLHEIVESESDRPTVERNISNSKQEIEDQVLGFDLNFSFIDEELTKDDKEVGDDWSDESSSSTTNNHDGDKRFDQDNFDYPESFTQKDSSSIQNDSLFLRGQESSQIGRKEYTYYKEDDDWIEQTEENMDEGSEGMNSSQDDDDGWIGESDLQFQ